MRSWYFNHQNERPFSTFDSLKLNGIVKLFHAEISFKKKKKRKEHSLEKKEQLHLKIFRENDSDFDLVIDEKVESWID